MSGLTWSGGNGGFSVGAGYHASSQYATFAGAVVAGSNIDVDVGGNLTVASRQDTAHNASSSMNGSGAVTIGLGSSPSSASVSGGGGAKLVGCGVGDGAVRLLCQG